VSDAIEPRGDLPLSRRYRHARVDALVGAAALSSLVFIWLIAVPAFGNERWTRHVGHLPMFSAHVVGGAIMLLTGAAALRIGLTRVGFRWHRAMGFAYLLTGTITSAVALVRSLDTSHTPGLSTGTLAAVWLAFAAMAFRAIRNRRIDQHREWMIRSYVAAWTFVFCRFWTRAAPPTLQGDEGDMIWMTWIVPILIAEICLQWGKGGRAARKA
jgi:uncharacterized membrane protein YozB (DUF420 family)